MKIKRKQEPQVVELSPKQRKASKEVAYKLQEDIPKYGWLNNTDYKHDETAALYALDKRTANKFWVNKVRVVRVETEVVAVFTDSVLPGSAEPIEAEQEIPEIEPLIEETEEKPKKKFRIKHK